MGYAAVINNCELPLKDGILLDQQLKQRIRNYIKKDWNAEYSLDYYTTSHDGKEKSRLELIGVDDHYQDAAIDDFFEAFSDVLDTEHAFIDFAGEDGALWRCRYGGSIGAHVIYTAEDFVNAARDYTRTQLRKTENGQWEIESKEPADISIYGYGDGICIHCNETNASTLAELGLALLQISLELQKQ